MEKQEFSLVNKIPVSIEVEKQVLNIILNSSDAFLEIKDLLDLNDFYSPQHKTLFRLIGEYFIKDSKYNLLTLSDYIKTQDAEEKCGGIVYLIELQERFPERSELLKYVRTLRGKRYLREMLEGFVKGIDLCKSGDTEELTKIFSKMQRFTDTMGEKREYIWADAARDTIASLFAKEPQSIKTGYPILDMKVRGLPRQAITVLAARPSMGKTALALNIAINIAKTKIPTIFYSLEMSLKSIIIRSLALESSVSYMDIRDVEFSPEQWASVEEVYNKTIQGTPFFIDCTTLSISELKSSLRRNKYENKIELAVIDYLQLITTNKTHSENRNQEVSNITKELRAIAKELDISILLLSQLSRAVENRVDRRPIQSDLRDSGSIEQDAEVIMFIYKESAYNPEAPDKNLVEVIVNKNRNAERNVTLYFNFDGPSMSFKEKVYEELPRYESGGESY